MIQEFDEDDAGKTVIEADGTEVGMVADVQHGVAHVEADPSVVEKMKTRFEAGEYGENTYAVDNDAVERIEEDRVVLSVK
jgi:sporulation protein YlmC with PRC-barrel domain